ncbi:MAG: type II secretion system protein [Lentisphaeria bacterium]|nr:type II secretion system protein [Lentisphaeria bacterium]
MKKLRYGFTLTELLTVITVFCILVGTLMPLFSQSFNRAKLAVCGSNMRNIGQSVQSYCYDNSGMMPNIFPGMEQNSIPIIRLPNNMTLALGRLMHCYVKNAYIFGCPGSPGHRENDTEKLWQSSAMVWTAYLYRGQNACFSSKLNSPENFNRPYLMDFACITNQGEEFAPHKFEVSNLLFTDCHVESRPNSKKPFEHLTAQAARHGEITPDCTILWQNADL